MENKGSVEICVTNFDCPQNFVWRTLWHDGEKYWIKFYGEMYEVERGMFGYWHVK